MVEEDFYKKAAKFKTPALLVGIFLIGFSVVYLPHGPRLSDPDAWHYYRYVNWILEDGKIPTNDPLQYYPDGGNPSSDNIVHSYLIAYTYKLAKPFGIELMSYLMLFPAIFGAGLGAIAVYLAAKELFEKKVAFLSALFYSFIPLSLTRVYAGTIDKEVVYGIFVFTALYFFLKSYKKGFSFKVPRTLIYPVLSGIFFGLAYASWRGGGYIILVISSAALIYYFFKRDVNLMKALLAMALIGPVTMYAIQPKTYTFSYFLPNLNVVLPLAVSFVPLFALTAADFIRDKYKKDIHFLKIMALFLAALAGLFVLIGKGPLLISYFSNALGLITLEKGAQADLYMATVAESQPSSLLGPGDTLAQRISNGDFYINLRLVLLIIPFGVILLLWQFRKKKEFSYLLAVVWVSSGIIAALQGKRLLFFLAPSAAVIAGFTFVYIHEKLKKKTGEYLKTLKTSSRGRKKHAAEGGLTNIRVAHLTTAVIIFGVTFSTLDFAVATMSSRQSDLPTPWYEALIWTKENTPENSVIFFWWDYGYYFQAVAERRTISDGGGNVPRDIVLANMFTSPEDEAMKYITRFVDYEKVPTYMLVSYEEFAKSGAINRIAAGDPDDTSKVKSADGQLYITSFRLPKSGNLEQDQANLEEIFTRNKITTYYIIDTGKDYLVWALIQVDSQGNYHPEWNEKLLVKLLPFNNGKGQGLKHFELVYTDPWSYVFIYKVK